MIHPLTPLSPSPLALHALAQVPPELEWLANLDSPQTRRAYQTAVRDFTTFLGLEQLEDLRHITRAHAILWRDHLKAQGYSSNTIRQRLACLSSLFDYLCDRNAVTNNPVQGVKRPRHPGLEGRTPAIGDHQARSLLNAPEGDSRTARRDRAILATLLYHGLRRDELCRLTMADFHQERRGIRHLPIHGKGNKIRYIPLHPAASRLIHEYLECADHAAIPDAALFQSLAPTADIHRGITPDAVYKLVRKYSEGLGFKIGAHALRATAATNALDNKADIAKVQDWLGHVNISTTRLYDHRQTRPEDSPTFKVDYGSE